MTVEQMRVPGVQRVREQDPEPLPPNGTAGTEGHRREPAPAPHSRGHLHNSPLQKRQPEHLCVGDPQAAGCDAVVQGLQSSQRR